MGKKNRQPRIQPGHQSSRSPRAAHNPDDANQQTPVWTIGQFDVDGIWGRSRIRLPEHLWDDLFAKLKSYESRTWAEIIANNKRDHAVPVARLIKPARERLNDLKLDDVDELFRLRLTGTQRVWGIREGRVFHLIWWDPDHEICPSELKNT
jgi:hypothetical protein